MRAELRSLSPPAAERVARHLVATAQLLDEDPEAALAQARAARAFGARLAVVREATGIAAYRAGQWAEAIAELRTARRLTGDHSHLPLIADSERALGRPERALALARSAEVAALPQALRAEMRIVESGARRDLGQLDAALVVLEGPDLDRSVRRPWSARLWYAYADTLLALGRDEEAREWFVGAAMADTDEVTDAVERLLELDGITLYEDDEDDEDESDAVEENADDEDEGDTAGDGAEVFADGPGGEVVASGSAGDVGAHGRAGERDAGPDPGDGGEPDAVPAAAAEHAALGAEAGGQSLPGIAPGAGEPDSGGTDG